MKNFTLGGKNNFLQTCWYEFSNDECLVCIRNGLIVKTTRDISIVPDFKLDDEQLSYYVFLEKETLNPWEISVPILEPLFKVILCCYLKQEIYYKLSSEQQGKLYELLEKIWVDHDMEDIFKKCVK
jgi:hypothetical protein